MSGESKIQMRSDPLEMHANMLFQNLGSHETTKGYQRTNEHYLRTKMKISETVINIKNKCNY